jgi:hypothetical protein
MEENIGMVENYEQITFSAGSRHPDIDVRCSLSLH